MPHSLFYYSRVSRALWVVLLVAAGASVSAANTVTLISRGLNGANSLTGAGGEAPTVSGDGRYVAFSSPASNFTGEARGIDQIYVRDRNSGIVELISQSNSGVPAEFRCFRPVISESGRFVVFTSASQQLAGRAPGSTSAVFLRDRQLQTTELIAPQGDALTGHHLALQDLAITPNGRFVAFASYNRTLVENDTNATADVFVKDRSTVAFERVSCGASGVEANGYSGVGGISISDDGRFVAFTSEASNLVVDDTNGVSDVFVRDRQLGTTERGSVSISGGQLNAASQGSALSDDARFLVFSSLADNAGDDTASGVFLRDRTLQVTERVSLTPAGSPVQGVRTGGGISRDGRFVVFGTSDPTAAPEAQLVRAGVFVRDRTLQSTDYVSGGLEGSAADGYSAIVGGPIISNDGRSVTFESAARNLIDNDTNGRNDAFLHDRQSAVTARQSVGNAGEQGLAPGQSSNPVVSGDGQVIAFWSDAINLVELDVNQRPDLFLFHRDTGAIELVSLTNDGGQGSTTLAPVSSFQPAPALSADGRFIAFVSDFDNLVAGDTNRVADVFVRDLVNDTTERINVRPDGTQSAFGVLLYVQSPAISADGRFVAYASGAGDLVPGDTNQLMDVFLRDRQLDTTERVSIATDGSEANGELDFFASPSISGDGSIVAFTSGASNLAQGDTNGAADVFVRNRTNQTTSRVAASFSNLPDLSADGRHLTFISPDATLTPGDTNGLADLFVRDLVTGDTERVNVGQEGDLSAETLTFGSNSISADGRFIAFNAWTQGPIGNNRFQSAVFVRDRVTATTRCASLSSQGQVPNGDCRNPSLDASGSLIAFASNASNVTSDEVSRGSDIFARTLGSATPHAPSNLTAEPVHTTALRLRWTDNSNNEELFLIEQLFQPGWSVIADVGANQEEYLVAQFLEPDREYQFRVRACNGDGFSGYTNAVVGATLPSPPTAPTNFTATAQNATSILLAWSDLSANESGFVLARAIASGGFAELPLLAPDSTSFTDSGLLPETTYRYRLRAVNAGGSSSSIEAQAATPGLPPTAPSDLVAGVRSQSSIRISWTDNSNNETSFRLRRSTEGTPAVSLVTLAADTTSYVDSTALPNVGYTYYLSAVNDAGESSHPTGASASIHLGGKLTITLSTGNFGTVKRGQAKRKKVVVKNVGSSHVDGMVGDTATPFRIISGGSFFALNPGERREVILEFAPTSRGAFRSSLPITSSSNNRPSVNLKLTGKGK